MDSKRAESREMQAQTPPAGPTLCRTGCGFYAHSAFDGMCSKCYKDHTESDLNSTTSSASTTPILEKASTSSDVAAASSGATLQAAASRAVEAEHDHSTTASTAAGHSAAVCNSAEDTPETISGAVAGISLEDPALVENKPKKKRCDRCSKRVGLTGIDCRCGGHFCSLHRYSDMHDCSFDYRSLAQSEIRKHNPVVAAEKVAKI